MSTPLSSYKFPTEAYSTPKATPSNWKTWFPTIFFFWRIIWLVIKGSRTAKQGKYTDLRWVQDSKAVFDTLEECGVKIHVDGVNHLASLANPPCVFIANHMSNLETFLLPSLVQPYLPVTFVVKKSLTTYPFFGALMRSRNPIAVTRVNPRQDLATVLGEGLEKLKSGISIIVFPQSTRSDVFSEEQFNSIGVKLAKKAGVPVVPVAIKTDALGNGKLFKDLGKIYPERPVCISFGEPITVDGTGKETHHAVCDFIKAHLNTWNSSTSTPEKR